MPPKKSASKKKTAESGGRKKKRTESFSMYIYKVLKQVHPDTGVSKKAMSIMNSFVNDIFGRISSEAGSLVKYSKSKTLGRPIGGAGRFQSGATRAVPVQLPRGRLRGRSSPEAASRIHDCLCSFLGGRLRFGNH